MSNIFVILPITYHRLLLKVLVVLISVVDVTYNTFWRKSRFPGDVINAINIMDTIKTIIDAKKMKQDFILFDFYFIQIEIGNTILSE